jgi:hypothetical protein
LVQVSNNYCISRLLTRSSKDTEVVAVAPTFRVAAARWSHFEQVQLTDGFPEDYTPNCRPTTPYLGPSPLQVFAQLELSCPRGAAAGPLGLATPSLAAASPLQRA